MIDRVVRHAELISLKGDSYRLKDHDLGARPAPQGAETADGHLWGGLAEGLGTGQEAPLSPDLANPLKPAP